jgi:hypothetical protein
VIVCEQIENDFANIGLDGWPKCFYRTPIQLRLLVIKHTAYYAVRCLCIFAQARVCFVLANRLMNVSLFLFLLPSLPRVTEKAKGEDAFEGAGRKDTAGGHGAARPRVKGGVVFKSPN